MNTTNVFGNDYNLFSTNDASILGGLVSSRVSVKLNQSGSQELSASLFAMLHPVTCSHVMSVDDTMAEDLLNVTLEGVGNLQGSTTVPEVLDYDEVKSVMVSLDAARNASICCNLIPKLPEIPEEFSTTIEANFLKPGHAESYTMHRKEFYDPHWKGSGAERIEEHSSRHSKVEIRDYSSGHRYQLFRNQTYPNGHCVKTEVTDRDWDSVGGHLQSTSRHLSFIHPSKRVGEEDEVLDEQYEGNDHFVRGIKCEKWSYQMNFTRDPAAPPNTYTVSHFFPVASWQVRAESYHRLPKRIQLNGSRADGTAVSHHYDYIDMQPFVEDPETTFDPCKVLGTDFTGNCGCDHKMICVVAGNSASEKDITAEKFCATQTGGAKVGEDVAAGVSISMFFVGIAAGLIAQHLYKRYKNKQAQKHMQFDDATMAPQSGGRDGGL